MTVVPWNRKGPGTKMEVSGMGGMRWNCGDVWSTWGKEKIIL